MQMQEEDSIPGPLLDTLRRVDAMADAFFAEIGDLDGRPTRGVSGEVSREGITEMLAAIATALHFHGEHPPLYWVEAYERSRRTREGREHIRNG